MKKHQFKDSKLGKFWEKHGETILYIGMIVAGGVGLACGASAAYKDIKKEVPYDLWDDISDTTIYGGRAAAVIRAMKWDEVESRKLEDAFTESEIEELLKAGVRKDDKYVGAILMFDH